jgi:hypothetical protein
MSFIGIVYMTKLKKMIVNTMKIRIENKDDNICYIPTILYH